jgi:Transposase C of IS166 homeodomain
VLPAPLPDLDGLDPETLKSLFLSKHNESIEQHKHLRYNSHEIDHLKLVMIFGRKSEKLARELGRWELHLEETETTQAADRQLKLSSPVPRSPSRSRQLRVQNASRLPEDLPREVIKNMPEHHSCRCCRGEPRQFGEDVPNNWNASRRDSHG